MVVGAFPAAKLGALLLRQISKPIADIVKTQAKKHPVFSRYVCMPPAQLYNWVEVRCKMWLLNLGKPVHIPVLNEASAIELGANLLGEGIIFIIAASILISELTRQSQKEKVKEAARLKEISDIRNSIKQLHVQTQETEIQIKELSKKIDELLTTMGTSRVWSNKERARPQEEYANHDEDIILLASHMVEKPKLSNHAGLFLKLIKNVEDELWIDLNPKWDSNLFTQGLTHMYENVFDMKIN